MSRFLDKQLNRNEGFLNNRDVGVVVESDTVKTIGGGLNVNDGTTVAKIISGTGTFSMAATLGVFGSINVVTSIDVPLTGAALLDVIHAVPTVSVGIDLVLQGIVLTANYVRMTGMWTGTTGAHAAVNLGIRMVGFRF